MVRPVQKDRCDHEAPSSCFVWEEFVCADFAAFFRLVCYSSNQIDHPVPTYSVEDYLVLSFGQYVAGSGHHVDGTIWLFDQGIDFGPQNEDHVLCHRVHPYLDHPIGLDLLSDLDHLAGLDLLSDLDHHAGFDHPIGLDHLSDLDHLAGLDHLSDSDHPTDSDLFSNLDLLWNLVLLWNLDLLFDFDHPTDLDLFSDLDHLFGVDLLSDLDPLIDHDLVHHAVLSPGSVLQASVQYVPTPVQTQHHVHIVLVAKSALLADEDLALLATDPYFR